MVVAKAVASSEAWKPAREFRRRPLSQEECAAAEGWPGTTRRQQKLQGQPSSGTPPALSGLLVLCTGVGAGGWGCTKPPMGICPPAERGGGPTARPLDSLTSMVVPRRPLDGFAESEHVIQRQGTRTLGIHLNHPLPFGWRLQCLPLSGRCVTVRDDTSLQFRAGEEPHRSRGLCRGPAGSVSLPSWKSSSSPLPAVASTPSRPQLGHQPSQP